MIWVYALSSLVHNYIYVGMTQNIEERFIRHNNGWEKTTKHYKPFIIILKEQYPDRVLARKAEKYWKSGIGKEQLRKIRSNLK